ncbi:MAG: TetR/AcrR family transcriptional regulator [Acidimicrobiia bacterium]
MGKPVKSRPYASPLRQEQAAQTRARILDAARGLFERDGFARTTVKAIAAAAKVAPDTVYATFGTKVSVLTALIDRELTASADVVSVTDRPEAHAVRDEPDQIEQLRLFTRDIATVLERVRPVYEILRNASAVDADLLTVSREMDNNRLEQIRKVAGWLAARAPLRVDVDRASEIIWAIASPDVARMLCDGRGWTVDDYAAWLEDTLVHTLLD